MRRVAKEADQRKCVQKRLKYSPVQRINMPSGHRRGELGPNKVKCKLFEH